MYDEKWVFMEIQKILVRLGFKYEVDEDDEYIILKIRKGRR